MGSNQEDLTIVIIYEEASVYKENAALNMPANLENLAVATGLEKVSFTPIPKNAQTTT